jgi:hypothetical protein
MTQTDNPLRRYFRQPAIYIKLPSEGKYYPPGTLNLPANGELPILPMTAIDEITSRTPDALFNGSAVMEIFKSCVPNISDPWVVPMIDITTLLVSVRLASYGHEMEINSKCPNCGKHHDLTIDLRTVLDTIGTPDYSKVIESGDLVVYFAPMSYQQLNENGRIQFEDQKIVQMVNDSDLPEEERLKRLGEAFKRITELTVKSIAYSIAAVKTPNAMVTDRENILDFLHNCPKTLFEQIRDHAIELREASEIAPVSVRCDDCNHQYQQTFTLDMTNFFGNAS